MKMRGQFISADGFDKNVAEKMPKIRRSEEPFPDAFQNEPQPLKEEVFERPQEVKLQERVLERAPVFESPRKAEEMEPSSDAMKLVDDLHAQLLASSRAKRALEMDLSSSQKSLHQLAQDNRELRSQLEDLKKEVQALKEVQSESLYLNEENADALERIREFQQELREVNNSLATVIQERDKARQQILDLEAEIEQNEIHRVKGRLKEREASHFYEESRDLQSQLEQAMAQNVELERKYEALKKSFHEVRESLAVLRDSCKANYYNLSENPE